VAFYHASCNFPVLSTWIKAVDAGFFTTFPDLTAELIRKFPPHSEATVKGHLDQARANQRSTKPKKDKTGWVKIEKPGKLPSSPPMDSDCDLEISEDFHPSVTSPPAERTHQIYASSQPVTRQIFSDPTGRFLTPSSKGNSYLLVVYDYDSNMIFAEPMQSRTGTEYLKAYKHVHKTLCDHGLKPQLQKLDNEASKALLQFMHAEQVDYQLVPPNMHRRNAAERAIRTLKTTSSPPCAKPTPTFHSTYGGTDFSHRHSSPSIFFEDLESIRDCRRKHRSMEHSTTTEHPLDLQEQEFWSTKNRLPRNMGTTRRQRLLHRSSTKPLPLSHSLCTRNQE
jgi:hypothetical protein